MKEKLLKKIGWSDINYWILAFIIGAILFFVDGGFYRLTPKMPLINVFVLFILIIYLSINLIIYLFKEIVFALFNKRLKKKKIRVIPSLILICFTGSVTYSWMMLESKIDKRMFSIAKDVQEMCSLNQKCPLSLTQFFDDVKLIRPNQIFTLAGSGDEISDNLDSIKTAGYEVPNDDSSRTYTYKLKPYYGLTAFNFRVSSSSFLITWIDKPNLDMETLAISGGISSELIGPCIERKGDCKTIKEHDF